VKDHLLCLIKQIKQRLFFATRLSSRTEKKISKIFKRPYQQNSIMQLSIFLFLKTRHNFTNNVFDLNKQRVKPSDQKKKEISYGLKEH
jgi:hypothetical protein